MAGGGSPELFDGLSARERYEFDTFGFVHLPSVLSAAELAAAQSAADRPPPATAPLPELGEFSFAAEPELELLATHPAVLPVLLELCRGHPHLVSSSATPEGGQQLHSQREADPGSHASYTFEVPAGRCRCDSLVVIVYLETVDPGDDSLLVFPASHKSYFRRPPALFDLHEDGGEASAAVPDGLISLRPRAGDFIVMSEATCHATRGQNPRRVMMMRYKTGVSYRAHEKAPQSPDALRQLLSAPTLAAIHGDFDALQALCEKRIDPELPEPRRCWSYSRNARVVVDSHDRSDAEIMTPEQRYLFDCFGFVHLAGVLSAAELAAARAAFERTRLRDAPSRGIQADSNVDGEPLREPALELVATHKHLVPILLEVCEGAPHLTGMSLIYNAPRTGPPRMTCPYGELHCHGELPDKGDNVSFHSTSGRVVTDDLVVFAYLEDVQPGDGGLGVVPGSMKANCIRPPTAAWPYSSGPDGTAFGMETANGRWRAPAGGDVLPEMGPQSLLSESRGGSSALGVPDGMLQLTPAAGDFIIISEKVSHCTINCNKNNAQNVLNFLLKLHR